MRSALAALLTTAMLAAGCSDDGPSVTYPDRPPPASESTSAKPERLRWEVTEPVIADYLGLYSEEDAEEVWDLALELVEKWHINPRLLQARRYLPKEFRPVSKYMTEDRAKTFRNDVRRAVRGIDRGGVYIDYVALRNVFSLVVFNLPTPQDGGWRTPMVAEPTITGAVLPAVEALRVDMRITAYFRVDRGVDDALLPYATMLHLYYRQNEDDEWKLDVYSGKWKLSPEIPDEGKKKKKKKPSESPSDGATSVE